MGPGGARTLLGGVVDYAGLFPPAGLSMAEAVREYAAARGGPDAWMLGRFVLPAGRLSEFADARRAALDAARQTEGADEAPWRLSAIVRDGSGPDRDAVTGFNLDQDRHGAVVDTIESRPASMDGIDWLAASFGEGFEVYVEVPVGPDAAAWLERVNARGLRGKVRTGGVTAEAFPPPDALAAFLEAAVRLGVPFKATAGLHHAVRGTYRLTYEPEAMSAPMYGYLNVLLAAAALAAGLPAAVARDLLTCDDRSGLSIANGTVRWGDVSLSREAIERVRAGHVVSFGSCSFREPSAEFRALAASG
jgi:hypothetical protein